jgi:hypothetical protein
VADPPLGGPDAGIPPGVPGVAGAAVDAGGESGATGVALEAIETATGFVGACEAITDVDRKSRDRQIASNLGNSFREDGRRPDFKLTKRNKNERFETMDQRLILEKAAMVSYT